MADKYVNATDLAYYHGRISTIFATDADLDALSARVDEIVSEGGEPNVIETVKVNGAALTPVNKAVDIIVPTDNTQLANGAGYQTASEVSSAISAAVSSAYTYKGSVANQAALPASGNQVGDVYDTQDTGMNYAWNGTAWDSLGAFTDLSLYWAKADLVAMTTAEIDSLFA